MKTVFVLFDSLNRHMLGPYGGTTVPTRTSTGSPSAPGSTTATTSARCRACPRGGI